MALDSSGWNNNLSKAPNGVDLVIQANGYDYIAQFDSKWGGGRGAWFDRKNQIVKGEVWCWRSDVEDYLAKRLKGVNIIPVR